MRTAGATLLLGFEDVGHRDFEAALVSPFDAPVIRKDSLVHLITLHGVAPFGDAIDRDVQFILFLGNNHCTIKVAKRCVDRA